MTISWGVALLVGGLLLAALAASGSHVLREFSRRQLEILCRRRRRRDLFSEILTGHDRLAGVADTTYLVAATVSLLGLGGTLLGAATADGAAVGGAAVDGAAVDGPRYLTVLGVGALLALAAFNWIPASIARFWSAPFLFYTWTFWKLLGAALYPLTLLGMLVESLMGRLGGKLDDEPDDEDAFEDEIRTMVTAGQREGLLDTEARDMIEGVMELGDTDVSDIMTPRSLVDALDVDLPWTEVLRFVVEVGRTRIPVYEGSLDNVLGILYVKDLLDEFSKEDPETRLPLRRLLRAAWFVPTAKAVDDLLRDFLETRNHMAIVVDEYRSVAGVVTIEDALEEIVGKINDESDEEEEDEIQQLDDSTAEAWGHVHLEDLNERLGLNLPEPDELDTIGGLVVRQLNAIPQDGDSIVSGNTRITVLKASRRRVDRVRLEALSRPGRSEPAEETLSPPPDPTS